MSFPKVALITLLAFSFFLTNAQTKRVVGAIGFYNVENLFDTVDDPEINDDEFLPEGDKNWNTERYQDKLSKISTVLKAMANGADVIGLAEIENKGVIEDLIATPGLEKFEYGIVHKNSPDKRGIDVALIYKKDRFKVLHTNWVVYPEEGYFTRDILLCTGIYFGDTLTLGVNHWPSRRSGPEKRNQAGDQLKLALDSIKTATPDAKIILMGDFNDDPRNASIKKALGADNKLKKLTKGGLYNTSGDTYQQGFGSLYYRGAWNLFDQIIVSEDLVNGDGITYKPASFSIFGPGWMRNQSGQYAGGPFRSFSYDKYIGGYSDHFPVYILIEK